MLPARVERLVGKWRPLAVLIAPATVGKRERASAELIRDLGDVLVGLEQPAVVSGPLSRLSSTGTARSPDTLRKAATATGLPVSPLPEGTVKNSPSGAATSRRAARANVQTLVRACWPGTLAPDLPSTSLGFGFAAARVTEVAVWAQSSAVAVKGAARLRLWGYPARPLPVSAWDPRDAEPAVYYYRGSRRAARALGGDMGLRQNRVKVDNSAPAEVTLVLGE
jgi:hypothetical protein